MKGIFQDSGDIFQNATSLILPPMCMAESFTSTSCIIFSIGFSKGQRFFASTRRFLPRNPFCFVSHAGSQYSHLLSVKGTLFPINYAQSSLYFILLLMIRYNRCRGMSNPCYFVWYRFKIIICHDFDIQNHNAEISLKNQYDSAKIGMVGISGLDG